ncbi:hypothetical protein COCC4DRAFT_148177 [Bipolaris maydis ATCC 48331]|uniref:RING-type domain-containing protein n=2 Tax=Cochliobolus heterostrophus TaxID=5016 RepID=M2VCG4_COCH5|nr:uncharacterized protein COCC4DRAFT_148177 [Bipolaris maydis ATCC 48331]EMD97393.1 hypothetical protein COCHEDRAFT_1209235 [Bipolaris maydis C5]KAJ5020789.1 hypothetical protein J3E73DRAFT_408148 [Bipolaris maydis]ENI01465.1 hypothetical protein COCC4DRAFT_148177 [Bipolaris maydis ATCC 48331]KAJ5031147.1 hypothetical protein J3E73DRAFT_395890 [Bipolaris maydis]KAJ5052838.1 hypothetical protein J3E74DRAFT_442868 [Bipolaris maydis]
MTPTKAQDTPSKLESICVGNRIVHFKVSNIERRFSVHEDRICKTSKLFKDRLQKRRKRMFPTDECCICTDTLDPIVKDISFCTNCGQNFHESCMETWKNYRRTPRRKNSPANCPTCRASWKTDSPLSNLNVETELDAEAVQIYMDWVYTSDLETPAVISLETDAFTLITLKLWAAANAFQDRRFKLHVRNLLFLRPDAFLRMESVNLASVDRESYDEIREFLRRWAQMIKRESL